MKTIKRLVDACSEMHDTLDAMGEPEDEVNSRAWRLMLKKAKAAMEEGRELIKALKK